MRRLWKGLLAGGVIGTALAFWVRNKRNRKESTMANVRRMGRRTAESVRRLRRRPVRFRLVARAGNRAIDTGRDAYDLAKKLVKKIR